MKTVMNEHGVIVVLARSQRWRSRIATLMYRIICMMGLIALAHPVVTLAHVEKPRHGGKIVEVGDLHIELVVKAGQATVYVSDHGKPIAVSGGSGRIVMLGRDGKHEVTLSVNPQGSVFQAQVPPIVKAGDKWVVVLSLTGRKSIQARFPMDHVQ